MAVLPVLLRASELCRSCGDLEREALPSPRYALPKRRLAIYQKVEARQPGGDRVLHTPIDESTAAICYLPVPQLSPPACHAMPCDAMRTRVHAVQPHGNATAKALTAAIAHDAELIVPKDTT